jgi:hypothetical protein
MFLQFTKKTAVCKVFGFQNKRLRDLKKNVPQVSTQQFAGKV